MSIRQITSSAALYFAPVVERAVPFRWFELAWKFLEERGLPVAYFDTSCADFPGDDAKEFTTWKSRLLNSLQRDAVCDLGLGCLPAGTDDVEMWRGRIAIELANGLLYVGVDEELAPDLTKLLRDASELARIGLDLRYGISYKASLADAPESYAAGFTVYSLPEMVEVLLGEGKRTRLDAWSDAMRGERRYLDGLFRGVYPASILSDAHVARANLKSTGFGKLSPLDAGLWLWEVPDSEIALAEAALDKLGLVIQ